MVRPILRYGVESLEIATQRVEDFGPTLQTLIDDMLETMYAAPGVGLAAPQVGVSLRLFVADLSSGRCARDLLVLANPEVVEQEGSQCEEEGCLSLPGFAARVVRPARLALKAMDRNGTPIQLDSEGLRARVLEHEIDHLAGNLFLGRIRGIKRDQIVRRVRKLRRVGKW